MIKQGGGDDSGRVGSVDSETGDFAGEPRESTGANLLCAAAVFGDGGRGGMAAHTASCTNASSTPTAFGAMSTTFAVATP